MRRGEPSAAARSSAVGGRDDAPGCLSGAGAPPGDSGSAQQSLAGLWRRADHGWALLGTGGLCRSEAIARPRPAARRTDRHWSAHDDWSVRRSREAQLRIRDDIALIGCDETPWASLLTPPLMVVRQPARDLGRVAAEMVLRRLSGTAGEEPLSAVLQAELPVRDSCGAVAQSDGVLEQNRGSDGTRGQPTCVRGAVRRFEPSSTEGAPGRQESKRPRLTRGGAR